MDLKDLMENPVKFWTAVVVSIVAVTGGSGSLSYTLSKQSTEAQAKAQMEAFETRIERRLSNLEGEMREANKIRTELQVDVRWIRETLEDLRRRP